jgi:MinD superfamily P-loop ATPase containing an inserted ferredoxin domain
VEKLRTEIYYFSGTGNSLAISRRISKELMGECEVISIAKKQKGVTTTADRVGFVFPVYCYEVPKIVRHFVEQMVLEKSAYVFAVATCNVKAGHSLFTLDRLLKKKGASLSFGMLVEMPGNALINTLEVEQQKLGRVNEEILKVVTGINMRKVMLEGRNGLKENVRSRVLGALLHNIELAPQRYKVSDNCTACGICEKICPVDNIIRVEGKLVWKDKCENCLACFHWCPKEAISLDDFVIKNRRRYRNPEINLQDMIFWR